MKLMAGAPVKRHEALILGKDGKVYPLPSGDDGLELVIKAANEAVLLLFLDDLPEYVEIRLSRLRYHLYAAGVLTEERRGAPPCSCLCHADEYQGHGCEDCGDCQKGRP